MEAAVPARSTPDEMRPAHRYGLGGLRKRDMPGERPTRCSALASFAKGSEGQMEETIAAECAFFAAWRALIRALARPSRSSFLTHRMSVLGAAVRCAGNHSLSLASARGSVISVPSGGSP